MLVTQKYDTIEDLLTDLTIISMNPLRAPIMDMELANNISSVAAISAPIYADVFRLLDYKWSSIEGDFVPSEEKIYSKIIQLIASSFTKIAGPENVKYIQVKSGRLSVEVEITEDDNEEVFWLTIEGCLEVTND